MSHLNSEYDSHVFLPINNGYSAQCRHCLLESSVNSELQSLIGKPCLKRPKQREGYRYNNEKPRFSLITPHGLLEVAKVATYGAKKYAPHNWCKGLSWSETCDSLQRHVNAWLTGEDIDNESGLPHMAHAAWNALALVHYAVTKTGTDDRYVQASSADTIQARHKSD